MYKIFPIVIYPFINVQNQIYDYDVNGNPIIYDMTEVATHGMYSNYDEYFNNENTPFVYSADVGSINFTFRMSSSSYNYDDYFIDKKQVKIIIFKDYSQDGKDGRMFYYFVEDVRIISSDLYEYDLSLDVIKTYFNSIMRFKNIQPIRFHMKPNDYFNIGNYNYSQFNYKDPLINKPINISSKIPLAHYVKDINNDYYFTGVWTYFYMSKTNYYTSYKRNNYTIIVLPKYNINYPENKIDNQLQLALLENPYLIKAINSDIPPFYIKGVINSGAGIRKINDFKCRYDEENQITDLMVKVIEDDDDDFHYVNFYQNTNYLQYVRVSDLHRDLRDSIGNSFVGGIDYAEKLRMFILRDNHPNQFNKDDLLYPLNYDNISIKKSLSELNNSLNYLKFSNSIVDLNMNGEEVEYSLINKMFRDVEIGYQNSEKMKVDNKYLDFNNYKYEFTSYIKHDLLSSDEVITYKKRGTSYEYEIFIKRGNELRKTKITDDYSNYLFLNSNSIQQREKQLNKWNDGKTIIGGTVGIGLSMSNPLGLAMGSYNMITNLFENELQRQNYNAEMEDRKKTPIQFESGNFNSDMEDLEYVPYLITYGYVNDINFDYHSFDNYGTFDKYNGKIISRFGYFTDGVNVNSMTDLFTRKNYNYIQLKNTMNIYTNNFILNDSKFTSYSNIPNQHLRLIYEIFENGVMFHRGFNNIYEISNGLK